MGVVRVTIYHGYEKDGRMVFGLGESATPDLLVDQYSYNTDNPGAELERVFLDNNAGAPGGKDLSVTYRTRSLSVGDIVYVHGGGYHLVENTGFSELTRTAFLAILQTTMEDIHDRRDTLNNKESK